MVSSTRVEKKRRYTPRKKTAQIRTRILRYLEEHGRASRSELAHALQADVKMMGDQAQRMAREGLLSSHGAKRGRYYTLRKPDVVQPVRRSLFERVGNVLRETFPKKVFTTSEAYSTCWDSGLSSSERQIRHALDTLVEKEELVKVERGQYRFV